MSTKHKLWSILLAACTLVVGGRADATPQDKGERPGPFPIDVVALGLKPKAAAAVKQMVKALEEVKKKIPEKTEIALAEIAKKQQQQQKKPGPKPARTPKNRPSGRRAQNGGKEGSRKARQKNSGARKQARARTGRGKRSGRATRETIESTKKRFFKSIHKVKTRNLNKLKQNAEALIAMLSELGASAGPSIQAVQAWVERAVQKIHRVHDNAKQKVANAG